MSQQIKCIQVDCWIHSKVPEPIAARFGQPLIVISIAKLDSIRIKANVNMQITRQEAVPHFNVGHLYELIVDSKDPYHSWLIVDLFSNSYWEGVEYI